jgi:Uncharacterised ArCR, COG2043
MMIPNPQNLLDKLNLNIPLIGFYDAPDSEGFEPFVDPAPEAGRKNVCFFSFYEHWLKGERLRITRENFGCGGAGYWMFGIETKNREQFIKFLGEVEGMKCSKERINDWLDHEKTYASEHDNLFIGPLVAEKHEYLKSVTFFVNPDQLSVLVNGSYYNHQSSDPVPPVVAPFGSGCMQMISLFEDIHSPQAMIGATDIAMRRHIPRDIMTYTVSLPMFRQLCQLDERSFLNKPFLKNLKKARGGDSIGAPV